MTEELAKAYNPAEVEQKWYKYWEESGFFKPNQPTNQLTNKPTFTIVIPPPNITGSLHMGHALNNSIQDLLIRYKRMQGFTTLWVPGTDHAGIATQNVVEREIKKEGKTKDDLGREKFIERVWAWKKEYGGRITRQLRRLGASCDWSRERFTMDEGLNRAVKRHFVQLYKEGLIYRGKRIINWCPKDRTAISDIEVTHETKKGSLWFIKYGPITVATTRPETMLGDTAIAVNPKDERYKHMWGKMVELPLVGRKIPIIKDDFVDPSFGTGAVKVTPAHDPNDYEMGMRHNLPFINILTPDGQITLAEFSEEEKKALEGIRGLDRFKARERIVELLQAQGRLVKIEDYETSIGHCYRCNTVIEPYLSDQWFVKVKPLAEQAIAAVEEGKIKFVPERWSKVYLQWLTNLRDWCISRQLWWGHQIPAWYRGDEIYVGEAPPNGEGWTQDPDVFDTWFSSALWPFSVLGWPDETEDLKKFYPTDVLVTSYDIIFFWVARMIMAGLHFMKQEPFHTVYFNALVKDIHGKKMSKSWGNVIDPLEVIDRAGADALRFAFISLIAGQGQDVKLSEDKITEARNFANKIWNVARFVLLTHPPSPSLIKRGGGDLYAGGGEFELADRWILSRLNQTIKKVTTEIDAYEFGEAARALYDFIWSEFCDWYVELAKIRLYGQDEKAKAAVQSVLLEVLEKTLKLLHPFMPFITEEIWSRVASHESKTIMLEAWPEMAEKAVDPAAEGEMERLMEAVRAVRNIRAEFNVPHGSEVEVAIVSKRKINDQYLKTLTKTGKLSFVEKLDKKPARSASAVALEMEIYVALAGLIDLEKETARLTKDKEKLESELQKINARLADENFLSRAKPESVENEKTRQQEFSAKVKMLEERLASLG
ncbi:valine--tRNA ligase [candidate division WOR-1 bacterium RIFCSPHIGHO2_01_FULL_53_15]|uniref:Valine--tRNA ligase n=1 Tax=candidate division WOR-1 bacterium RIFCSPHIGHO2_01_FULL_53_15 TaxID=1802564 RepID=A0A1F4Q288_UNCSA|nr:MAG: valine--tRNA ligase [candidate division WOR-1 bacterium RIFCSPHIGHO2_01_FULL_53_15]OGC13627.1 MAG: valine--tRNA ligase [candidate division WOR-1 bacterium RIFCSPHIGHO2_02_FULL_53_26]